MLHALRILSIRKFGNWMISFTDGDVWQPIHAFYWPNLTSMLIHSKDILSNCAIDTRYCETHGLPRARFTRVRERKCLPMPSRALMRDFSIISTEDKESL